MLKKILVGGLLIVMVGAVIAGAISLFANAGSRTTSRERGQGNFARLSVDAQGQAAKQTRGRSTRELDTNPNDLLEDAQGNGYGRKQDIERDQGLGLQTLADEPTWQAIEGVVIEAAEGVVKTNEGDTVQVGLGPSHYRDARGFTLSMGAKVRISGYWEDDEFKAAHITNLDTGDSIALRDASGRPMWSGQGRGLGRG